MDGLKGGKETEKKVQHENQGKCEFQRPESGQRSQT